MFDYKFTSANFFKSFLKSDFIQKIAATSVNNIVTTAIGIVVSVYVARILGPAGRGQYAVALTVGALGVQFGNLGLHASNTYYVSRNRESLPSVVGNTLIVSFLFGGVGAFILWMIFSLYPAMAPVHGLLLILSLLWIPFGLAYFLLRRLFLPLQEIRIFNALELVYNLLAAVFIGSLAFVEGVTAVMVFIGAFCALIISFFGSLIQLHSFLDDGISISFALFRENISYGFKAYLGAFFAFLVLKADLLMVNWILGEKQAGYYSIAVGMGDLLIMIPSVVGVILFPRLSAMLDAQMKREVTKKVALSVMILMIFLIIILTFLARPLVQLFYGKEFLPAVPAFLWLQFGIAMLSVNVVFMNYFASVGMPLFCVYSPGGALLINIFLNMQLIPLLGIVGASISSIVSYGLMLVFSLIYLKLSQSNV